MMLRSNKYPKGRLQEGARRRERLRKCTHDKQLQEIKIGWYPKLCVPIYIYKSRICKVSPREFDLRPGVQSLANDVL